MILSMPITMMIQISDEQNEGMNELAKRNHRSKRMEVLAAIDFYMEQDGGRNPFAVSTPSEESVA